MNEPDPFRSSHRTFHLFSLVIHSLIYSFIFFLWALNYVLGIKRKQERYCLCLRRVYIRLVDYGKQSGIRSKEVWRGIGHCPPTHLPNGLHLELDQNGKQCGIFQGWGDNFYLCTLIAGRLISRINNIKEI